MSRVKLSGQEVGGAIVLLVALSGLGCGGASGPGVGEGAAGSPLSGTIKLDGSSTVFPVMEAVAEEFQRAYPNVRVTVGLSGTGGGFKKFSAGETDISNASRPIKESEQKACAENGVGYEEFIVAYDGLAVVVHPENTWVDCLTVGRLKEIWQPGSKVAKWSDLDAKWPEKEIKLFGPGTDSGTFDYFTEAINGEEKASRPDYTASEDDNVLVSGIGADRYALGYFGYAYYSENMSRLKLLGVDSGSGCVQPSFDTVRGGQYAPLSRPLLIYVKQSSLGRKEVLEFLRFLFKEGELLVKEVGYVPVRPEEATRNLEKLGGAAP